MHKSIYKLTFFFIASFVMLVPFGTSLNIFSNAMAIETNSVIDIIGNPSSLSDSQEHVPKQAIPNPQAPPGPQGPPGLSVLDNTRFYGFTVVENSPPFFVANALCDAGDSATGGGYTKTPDVEVNYNGPRGTTIIDGWAAIGTGTSGALGAVVLCYDNPPLRP